MLISALLLWLLPCSLNTCDSSWLGGWKKKKKIGQRRTVQHFSSPCRIVLLNCLFAVVIGKDHFVVLVVLRVGWAAKRLRCTFDCLELVPTRRAVHYRWFVVVLLHDSTTSSWVAIPLHGLPQRWNWPFWCSIASRLPNQRVFQRWNTIVLWNIPEQLSFYWYCHYYSSLMVVFVVKPFRE